MQFVLSYRDGEWMELAPDAEGVGATVVPVGNDHYREDPTGRWRWRVGKQTGLAKSEAEARAEAERVLAEQVMGDL